MAKLIPEKYRQLSSGEVKIGGYHIVIQKKVAEDSGLLGEVNLKVYTENGKIIIEKGEE